MSRPTADRMMDVLMDGACSEAELASKLGLRCNTVSRIADNLVAKGLLARRGRTLEMARTRRVAA